jgi:hypothetical protein
MYTHTVLCVDIINIDNFVDSYVYIYIFTMIHVYCILYIVYGILYIVYCILYTYVCIYVVDKRHEFWALHFHPFCHDFGSRNRPRAVTVLQFFRLWTFESNVAIATIGNHGNTVVLQYI